MNMIKKINKGVGVATTAMIIVGGVPMVVHANPINKNISQIEAKAICKNIDQSIKNGTYKFSNLSVNESIKKSNHKIDEIKVKVLQEKSDAVSMAGTYIEKVEHEVNEGKHYLVLSIDSLDWMSNITVSLDDGQEVKVEELERSKKKKNDGKGKEIGKIRFEIKDLNSKILMHMNVEPMGNSRVAFRVIPINGNTTEYNKNKANNEEIKKDENKVKDNKKEAGKVKKLQKGDTKEKQNLNKKSMEDGIYTIGFEAYHLENPEDSSMLGNFFDKNVKLEVKNGKKKITMLNTCFADGVLDYRIGSNNIFKESIAKWYGKTNEDGKYPYKTYEMEISELEDDYMACVLAGPMGGVKKDIGDFSKYKKAKIVFNKEYKKGWNGFKRDKKVIDYNKNLINALIDAGVDRDGNGIITEGEIASIKEELDISVKGIKDISLLKNLGSSIKRLYLIGNHIDKLPEGIFDNLTNLEVLYLNGNKIKELPKGIFDKLTNLKELQLNQNKIEEIPSGIFDKLVNLKSLVISDNPLKKADFSTLNKLKKLEYVSIENCNIKEIPKEVFNVAMLRTFNASKNNIINIPKEISKLKELKELNLSFNYIEEIPEEVYTKLPNLQVLRINDNLVTSIPLDVFYKSPKLRNIEFIMNRLKDIPKVPKEFKGKKSTWAYPQKTYMNMQLSAKNGKIAWTQNLSGMDMIVWKMIHPNGKTATTLDEYKKEFEKNEILELMHKNSCEPTVKTLIQKKNSNGEYITLKEIICEDRIDIPEIVEDKNMKSGDEYRIVKLVSARSYSMDVYVLRDVAYAKASNDASLISTKPNLEKQQEKDIKIETLKEKSNEPSMAGQYVNKIIKYTEKGGKKYFTVTLNRMDWMKNVTIEVGGKEVEAEKKINERIGEFTFEVDNETDEVKMHMNVVPMGNARVAFRLVNSESTLKDENPNVNPEQSKPKEKPDLKPEQKPKEKNDNKEDNKDNIKEDKDIDAKILKVVENKNLKSGNYKSVQSTIKCKNKEQEKLIKENLEIKTDVTVTKEKDVIVRMELTGKYAFNSKVFVDGKQVDVTEIFKDRTELMASPEIKTESKKDNNKQVVEFKLTNINSKVELVTFDSNKPNEKIQAIVNLKNDLVNKSLDKSTLSKDDVKDNDIKEDKDNNTKDDNNNVKEDNNNKEDGNNDVKEDNINNKEHIYTNEEDSHNKKTSAVKNHEDINKKEIELKSSKEPEQTVKNENKDNEKISTDKKLPQTGLPINTGILASMGTILSGLGIALRKKIKK